MAKSIDITPIFSKLPSAAQSLYTAPSANDLATNIGGLFMNRNSFTRGQGDKIFGADTNGIWLGAADFKDAPFQVDMLGNAILASAIISGAVAAGDSVDSQGNTVSGQIIIRDPSGNIAVILNNTGLLIQNGKITIKDQNNVSIIDAAGLISTSNFAIASIFDNSTHNTSSSSFVDLPGSSLPAFTIDRIVKFQISVSAYGYNTNLSGGGDVVVLQVVDNGSPVFNWIAAGVSAGGADGPAFASRSAVVLFPAGTHNIKLQYSTSGGGNSFVYAYDISYIQLGK